MLRRMLPTALLLTGCLHWEMEARLGPLDPEAPVPLDPPVGAPQGLVGTHTDSEPPATAHEPSETDVPEGSPPPEAEPPPEIWVSESTWLVRRAPSTTSPWRGRIPGGEPFYVEEILPSEDKRCDTVWGAVGVEAWVCLDGASQTERLPRPYGTPMAFDPPTPEEYDEYRKSGSWDRSPEGDPHAPTPFVYGRRTWRSAGRIWDTPESWLAGDKPTGQLARGDSLHFPEIVNTEAGDLLVRPSGKVTPLEEIELYAVSRMHGVELGPSPDGCTLQWWMDGGQVFDDPSAVGVLVWTVERRAPVWVCGSEGDWSEVRDARGEGQPGWAEVGWTRSWRPLPAPSGVGDEEFWVDVDLGQQVVALRQGEATRFVTLTSTGKSGHATPKGVYRILDKVVGWDMASLPGAADPYHVEQVPWVMHFWPRYALHGAFWHDGFGGVRSHGCVNLSLHDARYIFDRVSPVTPPGWSLAYQSPGDLGSVVRVRSATAAVPERRRTP